MSAGPVIAAVSSLVVTGGAGLALARGMRRAAERMERPGGWPDRLMDEPPRER